MLCSLNHKGERDEGGIDVSPDDGFAKLKTSTPSSVFTVRRPYFRGEKLFEDAGRSLSPNQKDPPSSQHSLDFRSRFWSHFRFVEPNESVSKGMPAEFRANLKPVNSSIALSISMMNSARPLWIFGNGDIYGASGVIFL